MRGNLTPAGWVRLVLYVVSAMVGVAAVVATTLGYVEVAAVLGTVAGAGAAVTGGTAVANLPKAPDQQIAAGLDLAAVLPAVVEIIRAVDATRHGGEVSGEDSTFTLEEVQNFITASASGGAHRRV